MRKLRFMTTYIHCLKKVYHPTTKDNFNSDSPIPIIFGTNITEWICHWMVVQFPTLPL